MVSCLQCVLLFSVTIKVYSVSSKLLRGVLLFNVKQLLEISALLLLIFDIPRILNANVSKVLAGVFNNNVIIYT